MHEMSTLVNFSKDGTGNEGIPSSDEWLGSNLAEGALVGFDPDQMSQEMFLKYSKVCRVSC